MAFLKYTKADDAWFPLIVNFCVGLFIFGEAVSVPKYWLLLVAPINLSIALAIVVRNWGILSDKGGK